MRQILDVIRSSWQEGRLRRRIETEPSPDGWLELGRRMEEGSRWEQAAAVARRGLQQFPFCHELQEMLRVNWERHSCLHAAELEARIRRSSRREDHLALMRFYIDHSLLDEAVAVARRMTRDHPREAWAWAASGQAHMNLFLRDHLARDGERALQHLRRAVDCDPESFEARLGLAEAWFLIGATSKAAIQIMVALELDPDNEEARSLYRSILALPPEKGDARELLVAAEETDEVWTAQRGHPTTQRMRERLTLGAAELSRLNGVEQIVLCHRFIELCAGQGEVRMVDEDSRDPFVGLARGFRRAASLALKRMGFGAFEEARLNLEDGLALVFAAGTSVLLVRTRDHGQTDSVAEAARRALATWTGQA